ncbi:glycosyltransferase family 2 protein [Helicobacter labetoulli]|uniref:glycosyltransferase family 2 protein n=1 Tax=Helicobacter labetoulli TaxID=2315333 RepID=UPI001FC913E1|nr:glycosyltransferase family 2 protein [Helicobacter labetoulli]
MRDKALVSIIIPFYNTAAYLPECLDSILAQSYKRLEIILVDDGSNDESTSIAQRYVDQDSRICLIRQDNMGAGAARNKGLESARGKYVLFFDSDDYMNENAIYKLVERAEDTQAQIVIARSKEYRLQDTTLVDMNWALRFELLPEKLVFNYKDMGGLYFWFLC